MAFLTLLRKRLFGLVLVVFGVSLITFSISHLIPGDPARLIAGDRASDALVAGIRHQLGLDLPLYQQYGRYLMDLLHGDLGTSIRTNRPVLDDLQAFFRAGQCSRQPRKPTADDRDIIELAHARLRAGSAGARVGSSGCGPKFAPMPAMARSRCCAR